MGGWGGGGYGYVGEYPMHAHMYACMHARMLNMLNMDASMLAAIAISIHVYMCMCVHMHVRTPTHLSLPRAAGSPKQQNSISPELIEIIRFCLKILYL